MAAKDFQVADKIRNTRRKKRSEPRDRARPRSNVAIVPELADPEEVVPAARDSELVEASEPLDAGETTEGEPAEAEAAEASSDADSQEPHGGDRGGLVPLDPLSRYLADIRRFPILSREEEEKISRDYKLAEKDDPRRAYDLAYKLVTSNLRLVVKIANEFARASRNLLDLIQEGNLGLMEAVKHFNPDRRIRFPSYAVWWVRAYIYRYLINNWRLVKIGTTQAQRKLFFNLRKETERLEAEGFAPQPRLLAQRIGVKESEVREMQERMAQSEVSLDQPVGIDGDARLMDSIPDTSRSPEEMTAGSQWRSFAKEKVGEFESTLKDKELEIFRSRLLAEEPITLQEIGERFGISRERVRQIESRLKRRLKAFLKSQAADIEQAGP